MASLTKEKKYLVQKYQNNISKYIKGMRFEIINQRQVYLYQGEDFSGALDKLIIHHEPLLLDCKLFVYLCIICSIRDELGKTRFNHLILNQFNGEFALNMIGMYKLLAEIGIRQDIKAVAELSKGDLFFIQCVNSSVFHPASSMSANNLVCIGTDPGTGNQLLFQGFGAEPPLSLDKWKEEMVTISHRNLTYADLQLLQHWSQDDTIPTGSIISYKTAWKEIEKLNGRRLLDNELALLSDRTMQSLYNLSSITVPKHLISEESDVISLQYGYL